MVGAQTINPNKVIHILRHATNRLSKQTISVAVRKMGNASPSRLKYLQYSGEICVLPTAIHNPTTLTTEMSVIQLLTQRAKKIATFFAVGFVSFVGFNINNFLNNFQLRF